MRRLAKALSVVAVAFAATLAAKADTFTLTGEGNQYTFSLPSTPDVSNVGPFFSIGDVLLFNNGISLGDTTITFYNAANEGGLAILTGVFFNGPQLYTVSGGVPTFIPGVFDLVDGLNANDPYTLVIAPDAPGVPEPSSLVLLATGAIAAAGAARRRLAAL